MPESKSHPDVVVVGGGVIGLSIAYLLAREGLRPVVLDRRELGREASWAGAGIIAPGSEIPQALPMARLRTRSAGLYPEWSERLREETGIDNGYRRSGAVDVAFDPKGENDLMAAAGRWRAEGIAFERLEPRDFDRVEPALSPELRVAYFVPDRAQIRNPRHLRALADSAGRRGARLLPGVPCTGFEVSGGRVIAVKTPAGPIPCGSAVVSAGPWTGDLLGSLGVRVATPPVKGQIVLLRSERPVLRRIVELGSRYLVPRDDGRVLVGATEEDAGFDARPTASASRDLIDLAIRLCPVLADSAVEATWAGLRPGSMDSRPIIGVVPGYENLIVAAGHRRSGLQLSPATAEVVADLLLGRRPFVDLTDFRPDRPAAPPVPEAFRS
ncbi:glycine oxidase ThiO [Tautonia plasticadhaerens]|uniref:Hydrogen cyanide synthase subunit HcnC n=1 Tax=Tautonia plasticadhaerens TaxID=2527974 RepID=A0A518HCC8_9BACT|nr:glycine oxidase ThiO [Tautonia plasticadhaerens]QDV38497.1 Hydrogen cyanide synthase subunit HcnC precursor [Tautonia plasticadhaerens]